MKTFIRSFVYSLFALFVVSFYIKSAKITGGIEIFCYTSFILGLLNMLVKPILKVILFPINLLTFGLLSWIINIIILFLLMKITHTVEIMPWYFPGIHYKTYFIPSYHFVLWQSFIVTSFIIGIIVNLLMWIAK